MNIGASVGGREFTGSADGTAAAVTFIAVGDTFQDLKSILAAAYQTAQIACKHLEALSLSPDADIYQPRWLLIQRYTMVFLRACFPRWLSQQHSSLFLLTVHGAVQEQ